MIPKVCMIKKALLGGDVSLGSFVIGNGSACIFCQVNEQSVGGFSFRYQITAYEGRPGRIGAEDEVP